MSYMDAIESKHHIWKSCYATISPIASPCNQKRYKHFSFPSTQLCLRSELYTINESCTWCPRAISPSGTLLLIDRRTSQPKRGNGEFRIHGRKISSTRQTNSGYRTAAGKPDNAEFRTCPRCHSQRTYLRIIYRVSLARRHCLHLWLLAPLLRPWLVWKVFCRAIHWYAGVPSRHVVESMRWGPALRSSRHSYLTIRKW